MLAASLRGSARAAARLLPASGCWAQGAPPGGGLPAPAAAAAAAAAAAEASRGRRASSLAAGMQQGELTEGGPPDPTPQNYVMASATPVTRQLWQRFRWTLDRLAAAPPRDPASQLPKPPCPTSITYPFSTDDMLREHYRSPWGEVRLGRILEDLDSLAGYVAFEHTELENEATRPPLCVTASVEAIELHGSRLDLHQDMQMSGRVVWTGSSSMDLRMELVQAGQLQLTALFTFVARDVLTNRAHPVPQLAPKTDADAALFAERQAAAAARRAAREAAGGSSALHRLLHSLSPEAERWAQALLAAAKTRRDLPALAPANVLLMDDTALQNVFTCQAQNRNVHGRVFGGFLMRVAFELAHSTTYLFAGCRPRAVEVEEVTFQRPVEVGDLMKLSSRVLHTWVDPANPSQGMAYVQVLASVTQPEKRQSIVTNSFDFVFAFDLERDASTGAPRPPMLVLPSTEQQALEVARLFGPGAPKAHLRHPASLRPSEL